MTYFGFLLQFVGIPILILLILTYWDHRQGQTRAERLSHWPAALGILLHVVIALLYTTPWDNYLVATKVWWYDPDLVTGLTLGWVPIEEYTFFIVQPILGGLWLWFLARRLPLQKPDAPPVGRFGKSTRDLPNRATTSIDSIGLPFQEVPLKNSLRWQLPLIAFGIWVTAVIILVLGWEPGTYLALEIGWALIPITIQLAFGADILWRYRRIVFLSLVPLTLYLSTADALAINFGTWTISQTQSLDLLLGGILPIEEFIFFLLTNTLITFGLILLWAEESHERLRELQSKFMPDHNNAKNQLPLTSNK